MLNYYSLDKHNLLDLAKFVVEENYNHHCADNQLLFNNEIEEVYLEERKLSNSKVFVARDNNYSIVGSIRVLKWNQTDILPIQKLFNIDISELIQNGDRSIWHIGRFAIKKGIDKAGFNVFKTLMTCAINEVCRNKNSFALAECDAKLLRILKLLGIEVITLANSIDYLGSETIPVLLPHTGLKKFLDQNSHLLPQNLDSAPIPVSLHQSVVFQATA